MLRIIGPAIVLVMVAYYAWNAPDAGTIYEHRSTVHAWDEARAAQFTAPEQ